MDLVIAARLGSQAEADIACSALRAAGIEAVLFDNITPGFISLGAGDGVGRRLMVPEDQLDDAVAILSTVRPTKAPEKTAEQRVSEMAPLLLIGALIAMPLIVGIGRWVMEMIRG
jgi:hypothetical protein